jgi:exodeoxyribonuclease V alpha subunit
MEISGKVKRVLYPRHFFYDAERAGFILVLDGTGELTKCVGVTAPIVGGARLRLTGEYLEAANERTFSFDALERTIETDDDFEKVILNAFGESIGASVIAGLGGIRPTVAALEAEDEAKICSVRGVKKAKYASALSSYKSVMAISKANAGLRKLGMSSVEIAKSVRMLGNDAAKTVSSNPYVLCIRKIASWERADEIASGNGVDPNDPRRIATAVSVFLERLAERCGDVCCKAEEVVSGAHALLGPVDSGIIRAVCNKLAADGLLVADKATGMVFGKTAWEQRMSIKGFLDRQKDKPSPYGLTRARIEEEISDYEKDHFKLDDEQKEAVIASAQSMISVITGGPGTGKTTVLDCFLHVMSKVLSIQGEAALCAPTGKAAVRMEQSTHLKASTIHTLLSVRPGTEDLTSFMYNEGNKLCFRLLVVDESSMIDWFLGSSLLKATKAGTMIVFVGDVRQLHPVGAGFFFRDIIEYGAKASYLSKTHRQADESTVITFSKAMQANLFGDYALKRRKAWFAEHPEARRDYSFKTLPSGGRTQAIATIYLEYIKRFPIEDVIVLTPTNKEDCGVDAINKAIEDALLPKDKKAPAIYRNGNRFTPGVRVIAVKNNNKLGVVNGQLGYVKKIDFDSRTMTVSFDGYKDIIYDSESTDQLSLGYCITVHKSQGSEWPYVIQVLAPEQTYASRELVYTGLTRAKRSFVVLGTESDYIAAANRKGRRVRSYF